MIESQQQMPWKVSVTLLHALAVLSTCVRLVNRYRTKKLWWDDFGTLIPVCLEFLNMPILWLRVRELPMQQKYKVLMSYGNSACYITIIWWSRISLALAVARITPAWTNSRKVAIGMTILCVLSWLGLLVAMAVTCALHTQWEYSDTNILVCGPAFHVTVGITALDVIADTALIAVPLNLLWHMNHPSSHRRLVRLVFSASVLTLLGSLALCVISYAHFMAGPGAPIVWLMACYIAEAVSIITSNMLVLISWLHRHLSKNGHADDEGDVYIRPHGSKNTNSHLHSHPHSKTDNAHCTVPSLASIIPDSNIAAEM